MGKSVRIKAPEGKMVVSRVRKTIGRLVRTPKEDAHLYEIMDEAEAYALDREWHPEFYGYRPRSLRRSQTISPFPRVREELEVVAQTSWTRCGRS